MIEINRTCVIIGYRCEYFLSEMLLKSSFSNSKESLDFSKWFVEKQSWILFPLSGMGSEYNGDVL